MKRITLAFIEHCTINKAPCEVLLFFNLKMFIVMEEIVVLWCMETMSVNTHAEHVNQP
jgi:hypothetical protein